MPYLRDAVGFQWDAGNRGKCRKHGVERVAIEQLFTHEVRIDPDPSGREERYRAVGRTVGGRHVFVVFTLREVLGLTLIRPVSARFMHAKEVRQYEEAADSDIQER